MSDRRKACGVGMPAAIHLDEFGALVLAAFDDRDYGVYQVGSSLDSRDWGDIDVRLILSDADYEALGFGDPNYPHQNTKWVAFVLAFSALGQKMTGLPIDFQIQQQTLCNKQHDKPRNALGLHTYYRRNPERA